MGFHFAPAHWLGKAAAATVLLVALAAPAMAADLVTITLTDGTTIKAERIFPTYTTLVALVSGAGMRLVPNEQVKAINGVPFEQVYWGSTSIYGEAAAPEAEATAEAPVPGAATEPEALLPLLPGTSRSYALSGTRTTWVRHGRTMDRQATEPITGVVRDAVVGVAPEGPVAIRESVIEQVAGAAAQEAQILRLVEARPEGLYLVGYDVDRAESDDAAEPIGVPPRIWPKTLAVGQVWTVGPFKRQDMYNVSRMEVVGRETVTVPAGEYADAYKVQGFGHVWSGVQNLTAGRLITENGTVELTTWIVPGVGPVKEERKVHLHQAFFPAGESGFETPFVVEEMTTRDLTGFQAGK